MNAVQRLLKTLLGTRLPQLSGTLSAPGSLAPIRIRRDAFGVPTIEASSDEDVWFGVGFCHAQDRAGQLEVTIRAVRGTMAELAGTEVLGLDRLSRRIGFRRAGEAQFAACDTDIQAQLSAYCRGVNAWFTGEGRRGAHEHALLGCSPTLWEPADVQGFFALLCFALASNWDMELLRLRTFAAHGPEAVRVLDPAWAEWLPVSSPPGAPAGPLLDALAHDLELFRETWGPLGGSNAWAIAPERTASGRPILANDPHLNPAIPAAWYLVNLRTPAWKACGATFAGIPGIGSGHNGFAAWGVTAAHVDNTDFFVERIGPDGRSVRLGPHFVPCESRLETIRVKGSIDVVEEVLTTPRGPIVTPALGGNEFSLSLSATWLQPRPHRGFLGVHKARSFAAFDACFAQNATATNSVVYADADGHIAWTLASCVPKRRNGLGLIPQPGWVADAGWESESWPHAQLPKLLDPGCGFVATANNLPSTEPGVPWLGLDFLDGYRQQAITEALASRTDWTIPATHALQCDVRSIPWEQLKELILSVNPHNSRVEIALEHLRAWDGRMSVDSVAATIFAYLIAELSAELVRAHAPSLFDEALGKGATELLPHNLSVNRRLSHIVALTRKEAPEALGESWPLHMGRALDCTIQRLQREHGRAPSRWAWGRVRPMQLTHAFGKKAPLDRLFHPAPVPCPGDASTIAQAAVDLAHPDQNPVGVPTLRTVIDVGAWHNSRFIVIHGQSGNPYSPHYLDQLPIWQRGGGIPIAWSDEDIARSTCHTLELTPKPTRGRWLQKKA